MNNIIILLLFIIPFIFVLSGRFNLNDKSYIIDISVIISYTFLYSILIRSRNELIIIAGAVGTLIFIIGFVLKLLKQMKQNKVPNA